MNSQSYLVERCKIWLVQLRKKGLFRLKGKTNIYDKMVPRNLQDIFYLQYKLDFHRTFIQQMIVSFAYKKHMLHTWIITSFMWCNWISSSAQFFFATLLSYSFETSFILRSEAIELKNSCFSWFNNVFFWIIVLVYAMWCDAFHSVLSIHVL